jgi:uncharacterized protein
LQLSSKQTLLTLPLELVSRVFIKKHFFERASDMTWLVWLLVIVLVIAAVITKIKRSTRVVIIRDNSKPIHMDSARPDNTRSVEGFRSAGAEKMVSCARCGIYIPMSEAFFRSGNVYCCEEHSSQSR